MRLSGAHCVDLLRTGKFTAFRPPRRVSVWMYFQIQPSDFGICIIHDLPTRPFYLSLLALHPSIRPCLRVGHRLRLLAPHPISSICLPTLPPISHQPIGIYSSQAIRRHWISCCLPHHIPSRSDSDWNLARLAVMEGYRVEGWVASFLGPLAMCHLATSLPIVSNHLACSQFCPPTSSQYLDLNDISSTLLHKVA
jgi:hypothetical protein